MKQKVKKIKFIFSGVILLFILLIALLSILKTTNQGKQTVNSKAAEKNIKSQRWIQPNYHFSFNHPLNTPAWGNYFSDESQIDTTLSLIDVYSTWVPEMGKNEGNFLSNLVPILKKHNIVLAAEGGILGRDENCIVQDGITKANNEIQSLKSLYDIGGTLTYLSIDGFPGTAMRPTQSDCSVTLDKALAELIKYMKRFHEVYPEVKFGLLAALPNYGYGNMTSYWKENDPLGDYKQHFEKILSAINTAGEKIYYVHVDNPYDYAVGIHGSQNPVVNKIDWMKRILDLEKQVKSHGLRFGLIYNSETAGQGVDGKGGFDRLYFYDTLNYIKAYKDKGGLPDDMIIESWYPHPLSLFPDTEPYTFTYLVANAFGSLPQSSIVPVYRLINKDSYHFYTASEKEKNEAITIYGYTLESIGFKTFSSQGKDLFPVYRLTKKYNRLYTISNQEKNEAQKKYGYHYDGIPFYVYKKALSNTSSVYRLHNQYGDYFYTISPVEKDTAINKAKYTYDGIAFYIPRDPWSPY